jgi:hypothetical protein
METDENQKDYKQEKFCSLTLYAIIIDENQERWNRGEEKRGGLLLPLHTPWQETGHRKKRHTREHECPNYL